MRGLVMVKFYNPPLADYKLKLLITWNPYRQWADKAQRKEGELSPSEQAEAELWQQQADSLKCLSVGSEFYSKEKISQG